MNSLFSIWALRPRLMLFVVASMVLHVWHSASAVESTSKLAGIALPAGASRIVDAKTVKQSVEPLRTIAANLETPVQLQATEVLAWGGTGYKRESGTKIITTVQAALQAARFQTIKVGEPQNAQGSIISFFLTGATQQKKALLGYWLESDTLLMLVWGQIASRTSTTNPLDIKQGGTVPQNAGKSAPPATKTAKITAPATPRPLTGPQFPRLTAKPNQVTGVVLNRRGKPLTTAQIRFWRVTPQGAVIEYVARTNAQAATA
jgi:hypothetical protein